MSRTRIKICGIASIDDAKLAVDAGADALGMIFAESPRRVDLATAQAIAEAIPAWVTLVGVFVNPEPQEVAQAFLYGIVPQFSGSEMPEFCEKLISGKRYLKVFHIKPGEAYGAEDFAELDAYTHATFMFDTSAGGKSGGTGVAFDWNVVKAISTTRSVIVAGGLTPENVGACVRQARPFGVDVRSGVETDGKKDEAKVRAFVRAVREADAEA